MFRKSVLITLWVLALVGIGLVIYQSIDRKNREANRTPVNQSGATFVDVPWKHLPHVPRFVLTNQDGETFDSSALAGKPYAVSFFFASCPSICRDLNAQVQRLNVQLKSEDIGFVSISVDPVEDTPEVLNRYAMDYDATADRWAMLTGQMYKIKEVGEHTFRVVIDKATHTDNIMLVDKWGRYRDRFKWDDPYDMRRFVQVAKDLAAESAPPMSKTISTRNVLAGLMPSDYESVKWLREFHLTERSGSPFYTRDMTGQVWIANFFFTSCPGICIQQNKYLLGLQSRLAEHPATIVSITTDPKTDTPEVLRQFANKLGADEKEWLFCRGDESLFHRISTEFFTAHASGSHHTTNLFVVDKWSNVRGEFDWQEPDQELKMLALIDQLNSEKVPPAHFERIKPKSEQTELDED